jgi:hypothetical protein
MDQNGQVKGGGGGQRGLSGVLGGVESIHCFSFHVKGVKEISRVLLCLYKRNSHCKAELPAVYSRVVYSYVQYMVVLCIFNK